MKNQIQLVQSPIIKHDLISVGANVSKRIEELNVENLVATNDTIKSMKSLRAELNKEAKEFEEQRKAVKDAVNSPYDEFKKVYDIEVIGKYTKAISTLKTKIGVHEIKIKEAKQANIERYFKELCLSEKIDFLKFSQLNLKIDLSTSEKKYKDFCNEFVLKVQDDIKLIESGNHQTETMAEYKATLNVSKAITTVRERKEKEKAEKERILMARTSKRESILRGFGMVYSDMVKSFTFTGNDSIFIKQSDIEILSDNDFRKSSLLVESKIKGIKAELIKTAEKIIKSSPASVITITDKDAVVVQEIKKAPESPKEVLQAPKEVIKEEIFEASFEVSGTMAQLKALGEYMKANNISYENID